MLALQASISKGTKLRRRRGNTSTSHARAVIALTGLGAGTRQIASLYLDEKAGLEGVKRRLGAQRVLAASSADSEEMVGGLGGRDVGGGRERCEASTNNHVNQPSNHAI
ncbi:hypothetical protein B0H19DRAFT_1065517 [Mycena capillaripes]|nr:hypothetical protein B0H19DRAFT_1065517 [Mycena capillaripes]